MAKLQDFTRNVSSAKASGVSVNTVLKAQKEGQDETNEKLTDVAKMFSDAQQKVTEEQSKYDTSMMKSLISIDDNFSRYFSNLSELKVMLDKFVDPNYKMNKKEANQLHAMLNADKNMVKELDKMRRQDSEYNAKIESFERENNVIMRNKSVTEDEERRLTKKHNKSLVELWQGIGDDIGTLSTDVMADLKTGLIEGIGGPYASMVRKVLLPMFKQIKDSKLGQIVGDRFKNLGGFLKRSFTKNAKLEKELSLDEQEAVSDSMEDVVEEDKKQERKQTQRGVFKKLLDEQIKTNGGLSSLSDSLRAEINEMNDLVMSVASSRVIADDLKDRSEEDIRGLSADSVKMEEYLDRVLSIENINKESESILSTMLENSETDRNAKEEFQLMLLEQLEDIEDALKKVEGDDDSMVGDAIGLAIASRLGPLLKGALLGMTRLFAPIAAGIAAFKMFTSGEQADISKLAEVDLTQQALDLVRRGGSPELVKEIENLGRIEDEQKRSVAIRRALGRAGLGKIIAKAYGEDVNGKRVVDIEKLASEGGMPLTTTELKEVVSSGAAGLKFGDEFIEAGTSGRELRNAFKDQTIKKVLDARNKAILEGVISKNVSSDVNDPIGSTIDEAIQEQEKADLAVLEKSMRKQKAKEGNTANIPITPIKGATNTDKPKLDKVTIHPDESVGTMIINSGGGGLKD